MEGALHTVSWCGKSVLSATRTWKVHYTRWVGAVSQCCQLQEHGRCTTHGELVQWVSVVSYKNMEGALHMVSWCGESVLSATRTWKVHYTRWVGAVSQCCQLQEHGRCTTHGELMQWVSVVSYKNMEGALHTVSWCGKSVLSATRTWKVHYTRWVGAVSQCCQLQEHGRCTTHGELVR